MCLDQNQLEGFLQEAKEDEVSLDLILICVQEDMGVTEPVEVRRVTLSCVEQLLNTGEVWAGHYTRDTPDKSLKIKPWKMTTKEILARIDSEWEQLGREPTFREIVTFFSGDRPGWLC